MTFIYDATEESEDYFIHEKILNVPNVQEDDPLAILLFEEEHYIKQGEEAVLQAHLHGEGWEE